MDHPIDVETSIVPVAARAPARSPRARVPLQERWRHLERRLKRHVFRALGLVLAPVVVAPPDWSARPHRVLFLRHDRIGDMVLTTGILRAIRTRQWTALAGVEGRIAQPPALGRLVVNVSAGSWWRYWPEDRFIDAVRQIRSIFPHVSVLIVGAPEDEPRMERIGCALGVPLARRTSFRQLVALVAASDVVLTADTSVTHLASAFSKRVVALYARSGGSHWGPYGTAGRTVSTPAISLEQLPVEPVVDALATLLSTPPAG